MRLPARPELAAAGSGDDGAALRRYETVPARALAVFAHPDDPEVACAGTLAAWVAAGCEVALIVATRGEKGTDDPEESPEAVAAARMQEMAEADRIVGLPPRRVLGYPDGELEDCAELRGTLVAAVRAFRPEVVLGPDPEAGIFGSHYVNHRDHRVLGWVLLDAVAPAAALPHYFPEAGPAHRVPTVLLAGTLRPEAVVDVSATLERKVAAVLAHRSQVRGAEAWLADAVRRRAEDAGARVGLSAGEVFRHIGLES